MNKLFSRSSANYAFIDGIRAIAVLWVIFFHAWDWQPANYAIQSKPAIFNHSILYWVTKGDLGVDLFFVISGFLIGSILFKEIKNTGTIHLKKFYTRRMLRLMPVYIFTMLISIYLYRDHIETFWANLLYINNYIPHSYILHTWSLAIEEQFYIFIPFLLLFILPKFSNKFYFFFILTMIGISLIWYNVFIKFKFNIPFNFIEDSKEQDLWFWHYYMLTHLRYIGLLSGLAAAYLNIYKSENIKAVFTKNKKSLNVILLICLTVIFIISFTPLGEWIPMPSSVFTRFNPNVGRWYEVLNRPVFSYAIAFLIISCIYNQTVFIQPIKTFLSSKFFYPIAQLSYSAYLFHMPLMVKMYPYLFSTLKDTCGEYTIVALNVILSLIITGIFSVLMYLFIEQPFQKIRDRIQFA
jgi:peptidoglycan/LPS O-acetylase OafA/YrhL